MSAIFEHEKSLLQIEIDRLLVEKENSKQAFDKYRERARISLMKTANDLQAAESNIEVLKDHLKVLLLLFAYS
jgi:hypothetical protein